MRGTDLWSLGVVMFEMLTGTLPFRRERSSAIIHAVLNDAVPQLSSLRSGVPVELQNVIERALAKDLDRRCAERGADDRRIAASE